MARVSNGYESTACVWRVSSGLRFEVESTAVEIDGGFEVTRDHGELIGLNFASLERNLGGVVPRSRSPVAVASRHPVRWELFRRHGNSLRPYKSSTSVKPC